MSFKGLQGRCEDVSQGVVLFGLGLTPVSVLVTLLQPVQDLKSETLSLQAMRNLPSTYALREGLIDLCKALPCKHLL